MEVLLASDINAGVKNAITDILILTTRISADLSTTLRVLEVFQGDGPEEDLGRLKKVVG